MIFNPKSVKNFEGGFIIPKKAVAKSHPTLNKEIISEFWNNFTFTCSELSFTECEEYIFSVGDVSPLPLGKEGYSIRIEDGGLCLLAKDEKNLLSGFMTLLDRIKATDTEEIGAVIDCAEILDSPAVGFCGVHFCVFPETELWELRHFLRFAAALRYTHAVVEFWGTLRFDCMKELSWKDAYGKEDIRPIFEEANDLGVEIIPMFNHWGHAAESRARHGKHVVLDQNPALQSYFCEDGWRWDISKPRVKALLRKIRQELIELSGEGKYFHIGCDEAYGFDFSKENMDFICDFINEVSEELSALGRRAICWGDMFLFKHPYYNEKNKYECNAPSADAEDYLLGRLDKGVILADWQYNAPVAPVETAEVFSKRGFDCLLCPWDKGRAHTVAAIQTVIDKKLFGFLHTTWHTLSGGMPILVLTSSLALDGVEVGGKFSAHTVAAALWRKVMPAMGDYKRAGWSKEQIDFLW